MSIQPEFLNKNWYRKYPLRATSKYQTIAGVYLPLTLFSGASISTTISHKDLYISKIVVKQPYVNITISTPLEDIGVFAGEVAKDQIELKLKPFNTYAAGFLILGKKEDWDVLSNGAYFIDAINGAIEGSLIHCYTPPAVTSIYAGDKKVYGNVLLTFKNIKEITPDAHTLGLTIINTDLVTVKGIKSSLSATCPTNIITSINNVSPNAQGNIDVYGIAPVVVTVDQATGVRGIKITTPTLAFLPRPGTTGICENINNNIPPDRLTRPDNFAAINKCGDAGVIWNIANIGDAVQPEWQQWPQYADNYTAPNCSGTTTTTTPTTTTTTPTTTTTTPTTTTTTTPTTTTTTTPTTTTTTPTTTTTTTPTTTTTTPTTTTTTPTTTTTTPTTTTTTPTTTTTTPTTTTTTTPTTTTTTTPTTTTTTTPTTTTTTPTTTTTTSTTTNTDPTTTTSTTTNTDPTTTTTTPTTTTTTPTTTTTTPTTTTTTPTTTTTTTPTTTTTTPTTTTTTTPTTTTTTPTTTTTTPTTTTTTPTTTTTTPTTTTTTTPTTTTTTTPTTTTTTPTTTTTTTPTTTTTTTPTTTTTTPTTTTTTTPTTTTTTTPTTTTTTPTTTTTTTPTTTTTTPTTTTTTTTARPTCLTSWNVLTPAAPATGAVIRRTGLTWWDNGTVWTSGLGIQAIDFARPGTYGSPSGIQTSTFSQHCFLVRVDSVRTGTFALNNQVTVSNAPASTGLLFLNGVYYIDRIELNYVWHGQLYNVFYLRCEATATTTTTSTSSSSSTTTTTNSTTPTTSIVTTTTTTTPVIALNGGAYQIYVMRPGASNDWQISQPPESFFITGPFTAIHAQPTRGIAKLVAKTGGGTAVDLTFAAAAGFTMEPGFNYYQQRMTKSGTRLIVAAGSGFRNLQGNPGLFFAFNKTTGATLFAPWANIDALLPGITGESVQGVASYGDTIAMATGALGTQVVGITLYNTEGTPLFADRVVHNDFPHAPQYLWAHELGIASGTIWSLIAGPDGYYVDGGAGGGLFGLGGEGLRKLQATAAGGITPNVAWAVAAGAGGTALDPGVLSEDNAYLASNLYSWNGVDAITSTNLLSTNGAVFSGIAGIPGVGTMVLCFGGSLTNLNANGQIQRWLVVMEAYTNIPAADLKKLYILRLSNTGNVLTTVTGFNDFVSDCKFFRRKNDNITDQFIVVGGFTTYQGLPAVGMVFIDQFGNRLADLEWA